MTTIKPLIPITRLKEIINITTHNSERPMECPDCHEFYPTLYANHQRPIPRCLGCFERALGLTERER